MHGDQPDQQKEWQAQQSNAKPDGELIHAYAKAENHDGPAARGFEEPKVALVVVITSAAPLLGPQLSGLLTTYPVYAGVLAVFAHSQRGGAAAMQVVRGLCYGIIAFATFFLAVGALVDRAGVLPAFVVAVLGAVLVQALTLTRIRS